jgi:hypothetical protein
MENKSLLLDLVEWVARKPRPYADAMDAWRTSCPRFPIWEDALDRRFIVCRHRPGRGATVEVTEAGMTFLRTEGRACPGRDAVASPSPAP